MRGGITDLAGNPMSADAAWTFTTAAAPPPPPDEGPGGPILVITNTENQFGRYYPEILRAEGLNEFIATDISKVTPAVLNAHDVVILAQGKLSSGQAQMLTEWVQQGGNLIAMRPDSKLLGLLGLSSAGGVLANAYLGVDTSTAPGARDRRRNHPVPRQRESIHDRRRGNDRQPLLRREHQNRRTPR